MPRKFAQDTTVPISRSRGEIDNLLRDWGATGVQWTDEWEAGVVTLRFQWPHQDSVFRARIRIVLPGRDDFHEEAIDKRTGILSENKMEKLLAARGKREHRLLLIMLKSLLNAVDAGVVSDIDAFLPYLEGSDGRTVGEVAAENLPKLASGSASRLLPA
jgi:hypothetical protein